MVYHSFFLFLTAGYGQQKSGGISISVKMNGTKTCDTLSLMVFEKGMGKLLNPAYGKPDMIIQKKRQ